MDKQAVALLVVAMLFLLLWGPVMDKLWPPPPPPPRAAVSNQVLSAQSPRQTEPGASIAPARPIEQSILRSVSTNRLWEGETVALQNDRVEVRFSSTGGAIQRIALKQFSKDGEEKVLLNHPSPIPLLSATVGEDAWDAAYSLSASSNRVRAARRTADGFSIEKEFTLENDYGLRANIILRNTGRAATTGTTLRVTLGMAGPMNASDTDEYIGIAFHGGDKTRHEMLAGLRKQVEKQKKPFEKTQPIDWAAVNNQYFTILTTPSEPFAAIQGEPCALPHVGGRHNDGDKQLHGVVAIMISQPVQLAAGAATNWTFSVYAGPKEYKRLSALGLTQNQVLDFGMLEIFCKALLWMMTIFHGVFHNWGVAIIAVTVVVKVVFWPLTAISTKSMKQMQALAPKLNALKEKYKDDPRRQGEEMMKLQREYGINPVAGCLPMLVQMPIFIAFYYMLRTAIELRGASFLWIHDLSVADTVAHLPVLDFPVNLMPLIMAVTMIWQTRITPQAPNTDPAMKMMMWFMPAVVLFVCYTFSSGLSLYWTVQNLLSILQTYLTNRKPVEPLQKVKAKGGFTFSRPVDTKRK
ncbi:MAG: membrane protein insertase YidC [Verrucomicrobia bacterium]|nr:membrane protein insertase YidC [Verrucomicrobiota bacterium]